MRELENVMERMAILCDKAVQARDLPLGQEYGAGERHAMLWKDIERQAIEDALPPTTATAPARQAAGDQPAHAAVPAEGVRGRGGGLFSVLCYRT